MPDRRSADATDAQVIEGLVRLFEIQFRRFPGVERSFTRAGKLNPSVATRIRPGFEARLRECRKRGCRAELLWSKAAPGRPRRLRAAVFLFRKSQMHSRKPRPVFKVAYDLGDPGARAWVARKIGEHRGHFKDRLNVQLEWPYRALLPAFARAGMHVDCVVLAGMTRAALRALRARYGKLSWPAGAGYRLRPLRTRAQVRACLELIREEFTRNPQFGWFVTQPDFMRLQKEEFLESIKQRKPRDFVIVRGRRVVGQFGFHVSPVGVFNAPVGGMGFNFAREIQGRGFAKYAYAHVLSALAAQGIPFFIGGTSQIPVLKLSRVMGRFPISVELYPGKPFFSLKHYLKYLDS